jgi:hypothetical protein
MEWTNGGRWTSLVSKRRMIRVLVVVGIVLIWPRAQWLTDLSRPIVKVKAAEEKAVWLSDNRLLLLRTRREASYDEGRKGSAREIDWQGSVDLIDAGTGVRKHLTALTDLLNRSGLKYDSFRTSPDGIWVLWENTYAAGHGLPCVYVAHPDGTYCRHWIHGSFYNDLELYLDARHIIQVADQEPGVIVHNLANPALDREYRTPKQAMAIFARYALQHPFVIRVTTDSPQFMIDCIPADSFDVKKNASILFSGSSLLQDVLKPTHTYQLKLPKGATLVQNRVSPQQDSIFYYLEFTRMQPTLAFLHRLFPKVNIEPTVTEELWVSRVDGRGMHAIGYVPLKADPDDIHEEHLQHLQWLPNGTHISFIYGGTLYVTPAEPEN